MWASSSPEGSTPCQRHTTMGVSQIVQSAIQQTSSSWYQGVMRSAAHSRQTSSFSPVATVCERTGGTVPRMPRRSAGSGYLSLPDGGDGPGVLVLHSWWGLTPFFKDVCDRLSAAGFVALAPDLFAGRTADDPDEARAMLGEADMDVTLDLVRSSLLTLRGMPATPE